jgi:eukaryotic-like serine/threonine-protein kinase
MLKAGSSVGPVRLTTDFANRGGGRSQSAFGATPGGEVFVKRFLSPRYPSPGAPGSASTHELMREECEAFEARHKRIIRLLAPMTGPGGNIVAAKDFFRFDASYYKVFERLFPAIDGADVAGLKRNDRLTLMMGAANGLAVFERCGLINLDVKCDNFILVEVRRGVYGAKLIDYDEAIFLGEDLPDPEVVVGDPAYQSPELDAYIRGAGDGREVGAPSSVFSLGLVFATWQTGTLPDCPAGAATPALAASNGDRLAISTGDDDVDAIVAAMLAPDPASRPTAKALVEQLRRLRLGRRPSEASERAERFEHAPSGPRLRGKLLSRPRDARPAAKPPALSAGAVLRGTLLKARP